MLKGCFGLNSLRCKATSLWNDLINSSFDISSIQHIWTFKRKYKKHLYHHLIKSFIYLILFCLNYYYYYYYYYYYIYSRTSYGTKSIKVLGPKLWNSLAPTIKSASSCVIFKSAMKRFLISRYNLIN